MVERGVGGVERGDVFTREVVERAQAGFAVAPIKRGVGGVGDEAGDLAAREVAGAFAQAVLVGPAVIERGG